MKTGIVKKGGDTGIKGKMIKEKWITLHL